MSNTRRSAWLSAGLLLSLAVLFALPAEASEPPGYVGTETCIECHEKGDTFTSTLHGRADLADWSGVESCESCHGPGEAHAEEGDASLIMAFNETAAYEANQACLTCHSGDELANWHGSTHETFDLTCTSCHAVHQPWTNDRALAKKNDTETCLSCHNEQRKHMYARSTHPLRFGQMGCADCHSPHGSPTQSAVGALSVNEKCWSCHAETRGPFLWEHAPVKEDCLTCHNAHGSNQAKLLTMSAPRLCQSCHLFGHHQTVPGQPGQIWNQNRSCVNCHSRIHGSNHPSGIVLME
jgi:DmsE family decaheme c-type cytochrome